ncbi:hypothetical protein [Chengkuizengella axinellae]|uniref:Nucleotidyltransferase domain-containing protein n=1 Tax=Chengkuizengella axinellae TaxID=3064388 RepID=A0ABT9IT05_9BACL|nr:hypothetical protein [Chengkuizengella sp. 2205SS18-9]MDP5272496.1 hypothetical protein [Chengkuizengella sp. 2205SS18-9]
MEITPIEAAKKFINMTFPNCSAAFLAASAKKGSIKKNSDLDLVIFDDSFDIHFRKVYDFEPWPVEAFGFNIDSFDHFLNENSVFALPTIARICTKGMLVCDKGNAQCIIDMCSKNLEEGPPSWSFDDLNFARFEITDQLEDLITSQNMMENYFIVNKLFTLCATYILRVNDLWLGDGKWLYRELRNFDDEVTNNFMSAFESYYKSNDKEPIIHFVDSILKPFGGRLFVGFYQEEIKDKD